MFHFDNASISTKPDPFKRLRLKRPALISKGKIFGLEMNAALIIYDEINYCPTCYSFYGKKTMLVSNCQKSFPCRYPRVAISAEGPPFCEQ
jgi:hypothetical protein